MSSVPEERDLPPQVRGRRTPRGYGRPVGNRHPPTRVGGRRPKLQGRTVWPWAHGPGQVVLGPSSVDRGRGRWLMPESAPRDRGHDGDPAGPPLLRRGGPSMVGRQDVDRQQRRAGRRWTTAYRMVPLTCRSPTGRMLIAGPSTTIGRFVLWCVRPTIPARVRVPRPLRGQRDSRTVVCG